MTGRVVVQRQVRPTALIYCEGAHDLAFVRHVLDLYRMRSASGASITPKQGRGGSPGSLVQGAINLPQAYDRRLVKLDHDRDPREIDIAIRLASANNIGLNFSYPCVDALLLSILDPSCDRSGWETKRCKREFHAEYIPERQRTFMRSYAGLFTLDKIEEARSRIKELDELLRFIEA